MAKTIWLINQYASTPETGIGGRHYYLATELAKEGHQVFLISGSFGHKLRNKKNQKEVISSEEIDGFIHIKLKVLKYADSKSIKRAFNWFIFATLTGFLLTRKLPKPDFILYSSPALIGFLGARRAAKRLNTKLIFEVRDIWPLTLCEIGGYSPKHPFIRLMQWVEDRAYQDSDLVISNLKNAHNHMKQRGMSEEKFRWIPNGVSLDEASAPEPLSQTSLLQIPKEKFCVGYTGAIGMANGLDTLLEAAEVLKSRNTDVALILVGEGQEKERLKAISKEKKIYNVYFVDAIPKKQIQSMLEKFDVCYIGLTNDPLFQFGVSPNKLFDYMFSGTPVIYAIDSGDYDPISEVNGGISIKPGSVDELIYAIEKLYELPPEKRNEMGQNLKQYVLDNHQYSSLATRLVDVVDSQ